MANAAVLAAGFALALGVGAAQAGDADCVWSGIPVSYRNDFLAAYPHEGQRALSRLAAPPAVLGPVMAKCGVTNHVQNVAAVKSVMALAFTKALSHLLSERYTLSAADVDESWRQLTPARRNAFSASVLDGADDGLPASSNDPARRQTAGAVVGEVAGRLKVTDPGAIDQIGLYLTWMVARPYYEAGF
jgi:hypothetical protein